MCVCSTHFGIALQWLWSHFSISKIQLQLLLIPYQDFRQNFQAIVLGGNKAPTLSCVIYTTKSIHQNHICLSKQNILQLFSVKNKKHLLTFCQSLSSIHLRFQYILPGTNVWILMIVLLPYPANTIIGPCS